MKAQFVFAINDDKKVFEEGHLRLEKVEAFRRRGDLIFVQMESGNLDNIKYTEEIWNALVNHFEGLTKRIERNPLFEPTKMAIPEKYDENDSPSRLYDNYTIK